MSIYSIYRITNLVNYKSYTGFTKHQDPSKRFREHISKSRMDSCHRSYIHNAIREHGEENFVFEVIYQSRDRDHTLHVMEDYFITQFQTKFPSGYNLSNGGSGGWDYVNENGLAIYERTEETKMKRQVTTLRRYGVSHNGKMVESIERTIARNKGMMTDAVKAKIRKTKIDNGDSVGEKNPMFGMTGELAPAYGRTGELHPLFGKKKTANERNSHAKRTYLVTHPDGREEIISNMSQFCRDHDLSVGNLNTVANGKARQHKGYRCIKIN